jgi:hypothetical protein
VKKEITNALMKISDDGHMNQEAGGKSEKQEKNTQYLPPL